MQLHTYMYNFMNEAIKNTEPISTCIGQLVVSVRVKPSREHYFSTITIQQSAPSLFDWLPYDK